MAPNSLGLLSDSIFFILYTPSPPCSTNSLRPWLVPVYQFLCSRVRTRRSHVCSIHSVPHIMPFIDSKFAVDGINQHSGCCNACRGAGSMTYTSHIHQEQSAIIEQLDLD